MLGALLASGLWPGWWPTSASVDQILDLQMALGFYALVLAGCGFVLYQGGKQALRRIWMGLIAGFMALCLLEGLLHPHWLDSATTEQPIWIHPDFQRAGQEIDAANERLADRNPYGFTDRVRSVRKPTGRRRIAILGDSFLWGSGLDPDAIWSHRLEKRIGATHPNIEVMSWGCRGWSTLDEFAFFKDHGVDYDIDLLIVGFVSNDPDLFYTSLCIPQWPHAALLSPFREMFPYVHGFFTAHVNNILERTILHGYGYDNWERGLYNPVNLSHYSRLLRALALYCREHDVELLFVLTPTNAAPIYADDFGKIKPLLRNEGIPYLDLYPATRSRFQNVNTRSLWAHPADSHPGALMTALFADEVYSYLESTETLRRLAD